MTAVASVLVRDALVGPRRAVPVIATGRWGAYLDAGGGLVAVIGPGAVRVPVAVVVDHAPAVAPGATAVVGDGTVTIGGRTATVTRWFDPQVRLASVSHRGLDRLAAVLDRRPCPDRLLAHGAAEELAAALGAGQAHRAVDTLLGRGSGLTPAGDDLLAGALAALRALRDPAADDLGAAVTAAAARQTNRLSGALLAAADLGAVVPEAAAVLRALERDGEVTPAADALLDVGHTSGWHLAAGLLAGARHHLARCP